MRIFRLATTLVGTLVFSAILPVADAHAAPAYPPTPPQVTVSSTTVSDHGDVTLHGVGFAPREMIDITETDRPNAAGAPRTTVLVPAEYELAASRLVARVRANTAGAFTVTVQLNQPGVEIIVATGETSGDVAEFAERVLAPNNGSGNGTGGTTTGGLPRTGNDSERIAGIGGALIAFGLIVVFLTVMSRRRANSRTTPGGTE